MSEVKQEGDFSLKGKSKKPKQLSNEAPAITKVTMKEPESEAKEDITKVVIPSEELKPKEDAVQEQETESVDAREEAEAGEEVGKEDA